MRRFLTEEDKLHPMQFYSELSSASCANVEYKMLPQKLFIMLEKKTMLFFK